MVGEVLVVKKNGADKTERGQEMHRIYNRGAYVHNSFYLFMK